jgi:hypothetical protein
MSTIPGLEGATFVDDNLDTTNQFMSSYTFDVVAVVDPDTGEQLFTAAESMKANVSPTSRLMDHPLEDGSPVTDFRIVLPVQIELALLFSAQDFDSTYAQIKATYLAGLMLTVRTNADTFENLVIEQMPHDETPDMFGMIPLSLRMREVQLITVAYQALQAQDVAQPTDQSTVQTGEKQGQNSAAYDIANGFFSSK